MFDRINSDEEQNPPTIRDTEILVADVLELLANFPEAQVLQQYPALEKEDVREALLFAADVVRQPAKQCLELREGEHFLGVRMALAHPSTEALYRIIDVEDEATLLEATPFQVEYLKNNCHAPSDPEEGWYFGKAERFSLIADMQRMEETVEMVDDRIAILENKREIDTKPEADDELARLIVRAELFETKLEELEALKSAMEKALGDYDAFEFTWKLIKEV